MKKLKEYLSGLFILLVAFGSILYFLSMETLGVGRNQSLYHAYSMVVGMGAVIYFIKHQKNVARKYVIRAYSMILFVIVCYLVTRLFYTYDNSLYSSVMIVMLAHFVPCVLMGVGMLGDSKALERIHNALPLFVIVLTIVLVRSIMTVELGANLNETFESESVNYQTLSYYSIYCYGFSLYLFVYETKSKICRLVYLCIAILCVVMCLMAGGRGAFILGVLYTIYFLKGKISVAGIIITLCVIMALLFTIPSFIDIEVLQYGFGRVFNFFSSSDAIEGDIRWERWNLAWNAFFRSPLFGHGIGSVFYEVGMYSHNIFTDMLCEGGIILVVFFSKNLFDFFKVVLGISKTRHQINIIIIMFLSSFVMLCFSGYYLETESLWLTMAYVLPQVKQSKKLSLHHVKQN